MSTPMTDKRQKVDYARIEQGWREGILSPRQLAEQYTKETGQSVSHAAIIKHFNKQGIERDLNAKIQSKSDRLVTQAMVTKKVTPEQRLQDKQIVDSASVHIAQIKLSHRKDFMRFKSTIESLQQELDELNKLKDPDNLVLRTKVLKDLTDTHAKLVALERQAYNMDKEVVQNTDPLTELITTIAKTNKSTFGVVALDPEYEQ